MTKAQRVTNGHRAAVCGLMIAGLPYGDSCRIVGVPEKTLKKLLPPFWVIYQRRPHRWKGDELQAIKEAYDDWSLKVETIAELYQTTAGTIRVLAKKHGWRRRPMGGKPNPNSTRNMSRAKYAVYRKVQPILGREVALRTIGEEAA